MQFTDFYFVISLSFAVSLAIDKSIERVERAINASARLKT